MASTGNLAAIVLVVASLCLLMAGYAGFAGWPIWSVLLLAVPLALNRANGRAMSRDNSSVQLAAAFIVGLPVALIFAALGYAVGYGLQQLTIILGV